MRSRPSRSPAPDRYRCPFKPAALWTALDGLKDASVVNAATFLGSSAGVGAYSQLRVVRIKQDGDQVGGDDRVQG